MSESAEGRTALGPPAVQRSSLADGALCLVAITLVAFNMRPAVTSVGAVLGQVQAATGMSDALAGVLTSVPPVAFGVVGLLTRRVHRRLGLEGALLAGLVLLAVGLGTRAWTSDAGVMIVASAVALAGIAAGNVLLPVAAKRWFPDRLGMATSAYAIALSVGNAAAAAGTVPIGRIGGSWRWGLAVWTVPVVVAMVPLAMTMRHRRAPADTSAAPPASASLWHSRQARALVVFFGMQTIAAFTAMGWLPTIYQDAGVSPTAAGLYLALVTLVGAPVAMLLPVMAARTTDQRAIVAVLVTLTATAYVGLAVAPATLPWLWATFLGAGFGAFPLALTLIGLRAATTEGTSRLSAMTQGTGFLIAATGPLLVGVLHEATGGWSWPLAALMVLLVPQLLTGLVAARPGYVDRASDSTGR